MLNAILTTLSLFTIAGGVAYGILAWKLRRRSLARLRAMLGRV